MFENVMTNTSFAFGKRFLALKALRLTRVLKKTVFH